MKYDLVIFDMDGTVLNTLYDINAALNHALASVGFPPRTVDETRSFIGNGVRILLRRAAPEGADDDSLEKLFSAFVKYYGEHLADLTVPYDGIPDLLRRLREAGLTVALLSNKADFAVKLLCDRFFPGLFDRAYGARDGIPVKPDPSGTIGPIRELGVAPERVLYVGDSHVDLATAHGAGVDCALVGWGYLNQKVELDPERDVAAATVDDVYRIATKED